MVLSTAESADPDPTYPVREQVNPEVLPNLEVGLREYQGRMEANRQQASAAAESPFFPTERLAGEVSSPPRWVPQLRLKA